MDTSNLKKYAPKARRDFIEAVTDRAAYFGLTADEIVPIIEEGDVALIGDKPFPREVAAKRKKLEERIRRDGFDQVMEAMAYTWFNRLVAIRFMELHGYLEHGYRVLSHPEGQSTPEIVEHAEHLDLPGLKKNAIIELKLDGTKESELYRMLLIAQCNALHKAMPFLFESIDDETELLLPENLLHSDSLVRKLVNEIPDDQWQEIEIIGWLYQFYISEKKDEVIGNVVKSEDIPAATQLFTPNWIVKYLVQNSLGRQWMATYPNSPLKQQMEFYIEPAEQTPEVQEKIKEITPESLNPEELTLLDPACGSGHILVEAYNLLKMIYQERGHRAKDIPRLILQNNLFGLEIDDRAAQLAAFALIIKARADDRSIFERDVQPHVFSIQESKGLEPKEITEALNGGSTGDISQAALTQLIELFEDGKTLGSLIEVPPSLAETLSALIQRANDAARYGEMFEKSAAATLQPFLRPAALLAKRYRAVITNPPYMGSRFMNAALKDFARSQYPGSKSDLFAVCVERFLGFIEQGGFLGIMTPFTWMFIKSYEHLRNRLVTEGSLCSLIRPEYHAFFESAYVPICAYIHHRSCLPQFVGTYIDLNDFYGEDIQPVKAIEAIDNPTCEWRFSSASIDFQKISGCPIAYWVTNRVRQLFADAGALGEMAAVKHGMSTGKNDCFLRRWQEVSLDRISFASESQDAAADSRKRWFPYNKGGEFRKWFGNNEYVVNYEDRGRDMRLGFDDGTNTGFRHDNSQLYFRPSATWSFVSSSFFGVRRSDKGFVFDVGGSSAFPDDGMLNVVTGFLCSAVAFNFMRVLNPTLNFQVGNVASLPFDDSLISSIHSEVSSLVENAVEIARTDWELSETAWGFCRSPLLLEDVASQRISESHERLSEACAGRVARLLQIEEENNRLFIGSYGLNDDLSPEVPEDQITLYRPNQEDDLKRLISYAIGCMMGRYSLDTLGLIYAHSGNESFDPTQYTTFPADEDGIVPLTEFRWFQDDAASRFENFLEKAWPKENLDENLKFVAESLGPKKGEGFRDTIRRYLAAGFFKHHMRTYKKRPIYWLFSSGKQRAFQCLVYLHRYNEGTLARMRTEYVIPLQGMIVSRIEHLDGDISAATSTSHRKKLEKERDTMVKQRSELQQFDEKLRHYADQRIRLDLDDGVKVNYGKFGDLLAEVKAITGKKPDVEVSV